MIDRPPAIEAQFGSHPHLVALCEWNSREFKPTV
jgi:hypothetical protein